MDIHTCGDSWAALHASDAEYVVGIDLGGTGIKACLYRVIDGRISEVPEVSIEQDTKKPLSELSEQVASMVEYLGEQRGGKIIGIGIGMPGRFAVGGAIKTGTCPQLGSPIGVEFDGVNPQEKFAAALVAKVIKAPVFVGNDATAMQFGIISGILSGKIEVIDDRGVQVTRTSLMQEERYIALFGIGTGLGHAIVKVGKDGSITAVTDGHASKIKLKVDDQDWEKVAAAAEFVRVYNSTAGENDKMPEFRIFPTTREIMAENLISGPGIAALCGLTEGKDVKADTHKEQLELSAKYAARLITAIYKAENQDVNAENGWSADDKAAAAKSYLYVISGGFANSPEGEVVTKTLTTNIAEIDITSEGVNFGARDIRTAVINNGDMAAAHAAAALIPASILNQSRGAAKAA